jgi:hypothetical protein
MDSSNREEVTVDDIVRAVKSHRYRFTCEIELHQGITRALEAASLNFSYEASLSPTDRPDFLLDGIVVEVKIDGTLAAVTRQLHRYARYESVRGLVLVTSRARHMAQPATMQGKPVRQVFVGRI